MNQSGSLFPPAIRRPGSAHAWVSRGKPQRQSPRKNRANPEGSASEPSRVLGNSHGEGYRAPGGLMIDVNDGPARRNDDDAGLESDEQPNQAQSEAATERAEQAP